MTATTERPEAPERPPRSVPRVNFTDAEAGAKEFPDSGASARRYNYYVPAKRKQTHYEDVTVEVQPDPRHYLSQGWIYGFADGQVGYPLNWTKLKAWGVDDPPPVHRRQELAQRRPLGRAGEPLRRARQPRVPGEELRVVVDVLRHGCARYRADRGADGAR